MFDRTAPKYTDIHPKEPERFNGDEYAAKWLTRIFNPEFRKGISEKLDMPEIRDYMGIVGWYKTNMKKNNPNEIF